MKNKYQIFRKAFLSMVAALSCSLAMAQQMKVTGKVTDANTSTGLPGVTVTVKGQPNTGTATNFEGEYTLNVSEQAEELQFSFIGYKTLVVPINGRSIVNVELGEDVQQLDELVVVGYGRQSKREIAGSIVKVNADEITSLPTPSFESALQGKAAGVQVVTGSGMAGSGSVIRVRGMASVGASGDPLYVVDGVPISQDNFLVGRTGGMNANPLATLNPNDIESIEILKDAAAAGIYGSRAANGVVLITTKKGEAGKAKFTFNSKVGVSTPTNDPNMMNSQEWLQMYQEAWQNDGNLGTPQDLPGDLTWEQAMENNTNWWDQVTRTGFRQQYNLSMNKGTEKLQTYLSGGFTDNSSYLMGSRYRKGNGRASLTYKPFEILEVRGSSTFGYGLNQLAAEPWAGGPGVAMSTALPIYPIYNDDESYFIGGGKDNNPLFVADNKRMRNIDVRSITTLDVTFKPFKDFAINVSGGYDYFNLEHTNYQTEAYTQDPLRQNRAWNNNGQVENYNGKIYGTYTKELDDHKLTFMGGFEYQYSESRKQNLEYNRLEGPLWSLNTLPQEGDMYTEINENDTTELQLLIDQTNAADKLQQWAFMSYYGRFNYMFKDRYVAQFTARADGSSRFGKNNKIGFFPTAALSWIVSEEPFLKNSDLISLMKLRASYGKTGNANIGNYTSWGTFTARAENNYYNGMDNQYIRLSRLPNPDLKWETTHSYDVGLELGFLDDRITSEIAAYYKRSEDVMMTILPQASVGAESSFTDNLAVIENKGIEFTLKSRNIVSKTDGFTWTTDINLAHNTNKVLDDGNINPNDLQGGTNDTRVIEGYPVGTNFLVRFSHVDPASGRPVWLDKEGNETFVYDRENSVATGSVVPDLVGGVTNTFTYKGFDLTALVSFVSGGNIFDSSAKRQMGKMSEWNFRRDRLDYWRRPGDQARYPLVTTNSALYGSEGEDFFNSTLWLYDASFVRLRNVSLGYNLPSALCSKYNLGSVRMYVSGTNLLTFTKYPGVDPEIARDFDNVTDRNLSPNISWLTPPQERAVIFGLNVSF